MWLSIQNCHSISPSIHLPIFPFVQISTHTHTHISNIHIHIYRLCVCACVRACVGVCVCVFAWVFHSDLQPLMSKCPTSGRRPDCPKFQEYRSLVPATFVGRVSDMVWTSTGKPWKQWQTQSWLYIILSYYHPMIFVSNGFETLQQQKIIVVNPILEHE